MDPIYLICGFPRSGTSMMLRALEAGGMEVVYDPHADQRPHPDPNYNPNPHGYYELFNREHKAEYAGKVLKCLNREMLDVLNPHFQYRAVYMVRNPVEVEWSYRRTVMNLNYSRTFGTYWNDVYDDVRLLQMFGADVHPMWYHRVVEDPIGQLRWLSWPFDVAKAAATIDPALYRNRFSPTTSQKFLGSSGRVFGMEPFSPQK